MFSLTRIFCERDSYQETRDFGPGHCVKQGCYNVATYQVHFDRKCTTANLSPQTCVTSSVHTSDVHWVVTLC